MNDPNLFPAGFVWGAATSAYQVEGAPLADGAGPSNWHRFCHHLATHPEADTGDIACDHYRRYADDVDLMRELGLRAYRCSIAWSRLFPEGRGPINPKGIDFYRRLIDALERQGIAPYVTLHHWDLPQTIDDAGGWANPDCAHWFADYAHTLFQKLDGHVRHWITLNEPWVIVQCGYIDGSHPPGLRNPVRARMATHTLLRGHALAVQAFRADGEGQIGLVVNLEPQYAATDQPDDQAAMERSHAWINRQFLDPVFLGHYPEALSEIWGESASAFPEEDLKLIREPIDFLGINYYSRGVVRADTRQPPLFAGRVKQTGSRPTDMGWEIFPEGLTSCLLWIRRRYGEIPLYITENGAAYDDGPDERGEIHDTRRIDFLRAHLQSAQEALRQGVDLRGYFAWSLLDNFEWTFGYSKRFGLVHVDFATQARRIKASGRYYRQVIESQGACLW